MASLDPREQPDAQAVMVLALELGDRIRARNTAAAESIGLTFVQAKALDILRRERPISMRALAKLAMVDPSNLTGVVDRLEGQGLVQRLADQHDRRVTALVLTETGEERVKRYRAITRAPFVGLEPQRLREFRSLLEAAIVGTERPNDDRRRRSMTR
jgi:DNA-binding MarR family transcriptional regulator